MVTEDPVTSQVYLFEQQKKCGYKFEIKIEPALPPFVTYDTVSN